MMALVAMHVFMMGCMLPVSAVVGLGASCLLLKLNNVQNVEG